MKDLKPTKGNTLLRRMVAEGEHERQDFKYMISDARKIARSISAFANRGGGRLLIGVKDNGTIAGVRNEEDIFVVEQAAKLYCRPEQHVEFTAYNIESAVVICASIPQAAEPPVMAQEPDGTWRAYYRVADENIAAPPLMVRAWQRRADSHNPLLLTVSPLESRLLAAFADNPDIGIRPRDIAIALHCSSRRADETIVRLVALGILEFRHDGHEFLLHHAE